MTAQTELKTFPDQQASWIRWSTLLPQLNTFWQLWLSFSLAGALVYLGLFCLGLTRTKVSTGLLAMGAIAAGVAILLALDQQATEKREDPEAITFAALAYVLLTKRLPLLALLLFGLLGIAMASYYVVTSLLSVEFTGESGLVIKLPGQTVYYYPIHAYGWQNTQVRLNQGDKFQVEITGTVTPGYLQNAAKIGSPSIAEQWPFTGPEGYEEGFYTELVAKGGTHYEDDAGLTVQGYPHNTVIGVIVPEGEDPCPGNPHRRLRTPCEAKEGRRGYVRDQHQASLHVLSSPHYPKDLTAKQSGELWVTINDADEWRWDNLGIFFMKLTKR